LGGVVSLFASANPDGLEWSIGKVAGAELKGDTEIHNALEKAQEKTAVLPDYGFKSGNNSEAAGTAVSGIVGSGITLGVIVLIGILINYFKKRRIKQADSR
jgi:cobalt/nickel transport system permease protein